MRHLYLSRMEVLRLSGTLIDGAPVMRYDKVQSMVDPNLTVPGEIMGRLDLTFLRPGKDQPMPIVAGRAPDRIGVFFFDVGCDIRAGDRLRCINNTVNGTFEVRTVPEQAFAYSAAHHMEVQLIEVAQSLAGVFPGANVED